MSFSQQQIEAVRAHAKSMEMQHVGWNGDSNCTSLAMVYIPHRNDVTKSAIAWTIQLNYDQIDCQWYIGNKSYNDKWTYEQFMSLDIIDLATIEQQLFKANQFDAEVTKHLQAIAPLFKQDLQIIRDDPL